MMQKITAIFFLFVFSSTTTEFGQFLKLPLLVEHFYTHQTQESMSLGAFLREHYIGTHDDEDKQDDMQLPFKTAINNSSIVAGFTPYKIELGKPRVQMPDKQIPIQISFVPSAFVSGIFHPPRTV